MWPVVRDAFIRFSEPYEGRVRSLYADVLGLVTVGVGNLVDPIQNAIALPFKRPDGTSATAAEIEAAWNAVKRDPLCKANGWRYAAKLPANSLRLDNKDIDALIYRRLSQFDQAMAYRFETWETMPADSQLGILSLCWAMGSGFVTKFPKFAAAIRRGDYGTAANESRIATIPDSNGRNQANRQLFLNAARVAGSSENPSVLIWPGEETAA